MNSRLFSFVGGEQGRWRVINISPVTGDVLDAVSHIDVISGRVDSLPHRAKWVLRGVTSYERYVTSREHETLAAAQPPLNRPEATRAALIPIRKSESWWQLSQDERRQIFEVSSHIATGIKYLPVVARRLHHGYDLGEPFDFLTWFEYAPGDSADFERLVEKLRRTEEWRYVVREIDLRLERT